MLPPSSGLKSCLAIMYLLQAGFLLDLFFDPGGVG
jgi:hypothetical protein